MEVEVSKMKIFGSWVESEVAGFFVFSLIRMMGYIRLGEVRVKECPAGIRDTCSG